MPSYSKGPVVEEKKPTAPNATAAPETQSPIKAPEVKASVQPVEETKELAPVEPLDTQIRQRVTEGLIGTAKSDDLVRLKKEMELLIDKRLKQVQEEITKQIKSTPNEWEAKQISILQTKQDT